MLWKYEANRDEVRRYGNRRGEDRTPDHINHGHDEWPVFYESKACEVIRCIRKKTQSGTKEKRRGP